MKAERYQRLAATEQGKAYLKQLRAERYQREKERAPNTGAKLKGKELPPSFVAIDGEGLTLPDGSHVYVLLGSSSDREPDLENLEGLDTGEILRWLVATGKGNRRLAGFALNYDINCWLKDLGPTQLDTLWRSHSTYYSTDGVRYRLQWYPSHSFTVSVLGWDGGTWKTVSAVTVWDVYGFAQSPFLSALKEWGIGTTEELATIDRLKQQRADFADLTPEIREYNRLECKLLAELAERLRETLLAAGIKNTRWDGAGAAAAAVLRMHGVAETLDDSGLNPRVIMEAYFGGRTQALAVGLFENGPIYHHDINSAYPAQMVNLPDFAGGRWEKVTEYDPGAVWAVWAVSWQVGGSKSNEHWPLTPFPVRLQNGEVIYPPKGTGWYWGPLVKVAKEAWRGKVRVKSGWVFRPANPDERPFGFLQGIYTERQKYRATGDGRHRVLKFAMNAIYGKLAQGAGWDGRKPTFQSYIAAGMVTAGTQAQLLRAALSSPKSVISFGVDGIWARAKLENAELSAKLGGWRVTQCAEMFLQHPNIYATRQEKGGEWKAHTSGFRKGEYPLEDAIAGWREMQWAWDTRVTIRRFLGLGMALNGNRLDDWRRWVEIPMYLRLAPSVGYAGPDQEDGAWCYWEQPQVPKGQRPRAYIPKGARVELEYDAGRTLAMAFDQPDL